MLIFSRDDACSCKDELALVFYFTQFAIKFEIHPQKSENWIFELRTPPQKRPQHSALACGKSEIEMLKASRISMGIEAEAG